MWQALAPIAASVLGGALAGSGSNKTQTQQSGPPAWQVPYLQQGMDDAANLYRNSPQQYYPGSTVAPMSQATLNALSGMSQPNGVWGNVSNYLMNSVGSSPGAAQVPGQMQGIQQAMSGQYGDPTGMGAASSGYYNNTLQGQNGYSAANVEAPNPYSAANNGEREYAQSVLGGQYLNSNPYADRIASQIGDDIQARVGSQFAGAGRSMSGAAARAMAEQTGDATANFRGGLYENERNRMTQAGDLLNSISGRADQASQFNNSMAANIGQNNAQRQDAAGQFNASNMANAAGNAQQGFYQGQGNQLQGLSLGLNAADSLAGRMDQASQFGQQFDLNALGMLPGLDNQRRLGNSDMLAAGGMLDAYGQAQLTDQVNRWNYDQNQPFANIERYLAMVGGNAGETRTATQSQNQGANVLGGALTGLGLYNNLFGNAGGAAGALGNSLGGNLAAAGNVGPGFAGPFNAAGSGGAWGGGY